MKLRNLVTFFTLAVLWTGCPGNENDDQPIVPDSPSQWEMTHKPLVKVTVKYTDGSKSTGSVDPEAVQPGLSAPVPVAITWDSVTGTLTFQGSPLGIYNPETRTTGLVTANVSSTPLAGCTLSNTVQGEIAYKSQYENTLTRILTVELVGASCQTHLADWIDDLRSGVFNADFPEEFKIALFANAFDWSKFELVKSVIIDSSFDGVQTLPVPTASDSRDEEELAPLLLDAPELGTELTEGELLDAFDAQQE